MPTVAVKPTRVATDWLDGDKFTRFMKTWRFISVSLSIAKNTMITYFPAFDCKKNFRISIQKCTRMHFLKWQKKSYAPSLGPSSRGEGTPSLHPLPPRCLWRLDSRALGAGPPLLLWQIEHWLQVWYRKGNLQVKFIFWVGGCICVRIYRGIQYKNPLRYPLLNLVLAARNSWT